MRASVQVSFNAVVEGEYWYNNERPEIVFPRVVLCNIPVRDEYTPGWMPFILPAQTLCRIPAWWTVTSRDEAYSGYVAVIDVIDPLGNTRVESKRVALPEARPRERTSAWLSMEPTTSGVLMIRPGLVWDRVRWYNADSWFAYREVRFVPPLAYVSGAIVAGVVWWWLWGLTGRWQRWRLWILSRTLLAVAAVWLGMNLVVSEYWVGPVALIVVQLTKVAKWKRTGMRTYMVS